MTNTFKGYKDLIVWQKAMLFVTLIYKFTARFPEEEKYSLVSQIRRAVISIPANIAEGYSRYSKKELVRFLLISNGSLAEVETFLEIALNLNYISENELNIANQDKEELRRLLKALVEKSKSMS